MTGNLTSENRAWKGWVGVDLDGTLAEYNGWKGPTHIGRPIPKMVKRVKEWLETGRDVRIFTARVSHNGGAHRILEAQAAQYAIRDWCVRVFNVELPVTCMKDFAMDELWDDRAVQVRKNTGERMDGEPEGDSTP